MLPPYFWRWLISRGLPTHSPKSPIMRLCRCDFRPFFLYGLWESHLQMVCVLSSDLASPPPPSFAPKVLVCMTRPVTSCLLLWPGKRFWPIEHHLPEEDFEELTVNELKDELRKRKLKAEKLLCRLFPTVFLEDKGKRTDICNIFVALQRNLEREEPQKPQDRGWGKNPAVRIGLWHEEDADFKTSGFLAVALLSCEGGNEKVGFSRVLARVWLEPYVGWAPFISRMLHHVELIFSSCLRSLFVCLFVCLSVCLFLCFFVCSSVGFFVCLFGSESKRTILSDMAEKEKTDYIIDMFLWREGYVFKSRSEESQQTSGLLGLAQLLVVCSWFLFGEYPVSEARGQGGKWACQRRDLGGTTSSFRATEKSPESALVDQGATFL